MKTEERDIAILQTQMLDVKSDVVDVKADVRYIKQEFLTRKEFLDAFLPVRNGFFGMITLVATGFLGAVINFFIRK